MLNKTPVTIPSRPINLYVCYHPNFRVIKSVRDAIPPPRNPADRNMELAVALNLGPKLSRMTPDAAGPVQAKHPNRILKMQKVPTEVVMPERTVIKLHNILNPAKSFTLENLSVI